MYQLISAWAKHMYDFIEYKKSCGYKYTSAYKTLAMFDKYYNSLGIVNLFFSKEIIEGFLILKPDEKISNQAGKTTVLRQFGKYLFVNSIIEDIYIIPTISLKGESEYIPYIYKHQELVKINSYMESYKPCKIQGAFELCPNTLNVLPVSFKVLMSTGMRIGELRNLRLSNIDFNNNLIVVEEAKNDNKRVIPISNTLKSHIIKYINKTPYFISTNDYLFTFEKGTQMSKGFLGFYLHKALKHLGIPHLRGKGPRIHDFRHTACCMILEQLQKTENNINLSLTYLSAFLGHKSINETQKYIWLTPSLFNSIKVKMEDYSSFIFDRFMEEKFDEED